MCEQCDPDSRKACQLACKYRFWKKMNNIYSTNEDSVARSGLGNSRTNLGGFPQLEFVPLTTL